MPPILLAVFHCSLYREHISSWGGGGLISISAPPRGATGEVMHNIIVFEISIHAPPRGATWSFPPSRDYPTFQFTPLREGRPGRRRCTPQSPRYFNSRPSARGDRSCRRRHAGQAPFQFTPLREGRPSTAGAVGSPPAISIHAPPRGATFSGCNAIITEH